MTYLSTARGIAEEIIENISSVCWCVDENGNGLCHGKVLIELIEKYCK